VLEEVRIGLDESVPTWHRYSCDRLTCDLLDERLDLPRGDCGFPSIRDSLAIAFERFVADRPSFRRGDQLVQLTIDN
jgi:hypothetical protein